MTLTRRNFLKGLLATAGAAVLVPQALIEPVHGASDLTPRERDIAADVMGLRREMWTGWQPYRYVTIDDGPRRLLESFDLSRPEPHIEYGAEWAYTTYHGGWSGEVFVGLNDSALLADVLGSGVRDPAVRIRIVMGEQTVLDGLARIDSYSIIGEQVALGISQASSAPDYTLASRW